MPQKYRAPFGRRIAHRSYQARRRGGRRRTVIVEIGTPAAVPGSDWGCRVRVRGLSESIDQTIFGVDSLQALELGLMYSGAALSSSAEFRAGKLELWGKPATNLSDLVLPLGCTHCRAQSRRSPGCSSGSRPVSSSTKPCSADSSLSYGTPRRTSRCSPVDFR